MAAGWNPNMDELVRRMMQNQQDGDSWYSDSWLDQAIGGMGDLGRNTWRGINDLGEKWFGGGPGDFSGQVETARQYSEDTADEYENIIRNPIGYAKQNPSATLAGLAGLAAGGGGAAAGLLRHGSRIGSTYAPDAPSTAHGIRSRLSNAEEQGINDDFATRLMRDDDAFLAHQAERSLQERIGRGDTLSEAVGRIKGTDSRLGDIVDRIGRGYRDERGGTAGPDPAGRVGEAFDKGTRSKADDLKGDPESRSLDDLNPGRRAVADVLSTTEWAGDMKKPTTAGLIEEMIQNAQRRVNAEKLGDTPENLMRQESTGGHQTPMNAQGGAGITSIRQGRRAGGEGDPYQVVHDEHVPRRERRNPQTNERINEIPEERTLPGEGAASGGPAHYERIEDDYGRPTASSGVSEGYSGGIRDLAGNPRRPTLEDLFEHETDVGNIESIRQKGIEARWDPAEGDTPRRLVSARRKGEDSDVPEGRARIIFRSKQTPMERGGLNAVKFREGISPEDIVDIVQAKKSTLGRLADDTRRSGRELDPDFETKPKPSPSPPRKSKAKPTPPPTPPHLSTKGMSPGEMAIRAHQQR